MSWRLGLYFHGECYVTCISYKCRLIGGRCREPRHNVKKEKSPDEDV